MTDQERIEHLEGQVAWLSAAIAELGLQAFPELDALNPVHGSGRSRARLLRYAGNVVRAVDLYGPATTYAADLDAFARRREQEASREPWLMTELEAKAIRRRVAEQTASDR